MQKLATLMFFCTLVLVVVLGSDNVASELELKITTGLIKGQYLTTKNGREFRAFMGIPYAKPPLEELRFKPPVPIDRWSDTLDATSIHAVCPQRDIYRRSELIEGEEDCLYLNVYAPKNLKKNDAPLPVMVFFHGGGWLCGGGNGMWYGPQRLLDRDIILVVPNYRLGALGFLSTGDEVLPGNNGLKDQNLALKWVQQNIATFGGDKNSVTLFGESAGGASVNYHILSPLSKGLFHKGISQSGTALCVWAHAPSDEPKKQAKKLGEALNCPTDSSQDLVDCLRKIDARTIIEQDKIFMDWDFDPMIPFKPVAEPDIDGAFITKHPVDIIKSGKFNHVPWIVGLNTEDGALRSAGLFGNPYLIDELKNNFERNAPISLMYGPSAKPQDVDVITSKIKDYYFSGKDISMDTISEITDMYTDAWFLTCAEEAVRLYSQNSAHPVYYYLFGHNGAASFSKIFGGGETKMGVCHADELQYLFPIGDGLFPDKPPSENDKKVQNMMTTLWANFAKSGNPTSNLETQWKPTLSEKMEYLLINSTGIEMKEGLLLDRAKFWRSLPVYPQKGSIRDEL